MDDGNVGAVNEKGHRIAMAQLLPPWVDEMMSVTQHFKKSTPVYSSEMPSR